MQGINQGDFDRSGAELNIQENAGRPVIRSAGPDEDNAGEPGVGDAMMADDIGWLAHLFRWCGMALVVASPLIVIATLLHPSRETAATIIASEARLIAAHALFTLYCLLILLGLPGLYAAQRGGLGRLGLAGFLTAWTGTYLIPVTGYFGFLAPVLARQSPDVLDAINQYNPVVIISGLAAICFIVGYAIFGTAMTRTVTLPRLSGVLVAVGGPAYLLGWGISQLVSTAAWLVAVLGALSLGAGLAWPGYLIWQKPAASDPRPVDKKAPA
jgi:hypothetical protein